MQFIISQDRDMIVAFTRALYAIPAYSKFRGHKILLGVNLFHGKNIFGKGRDFLGTFDSSDEADAEKKRIECCADETIRVRGYCLGGDDE